MTAPPASTPALGRYLRSVGLALAALALLFNPWVVEALGPEERLPAEALGETIRAEVVFAVMAVLLWFAGRRCEKRELSVTGRRGVLVAASLAIPLVVAECLLAPFVERSTSIFQRDDTLGWKLVPGASDFWLGIGVSINSRGIRGPERAYEKAAGTRRVLFLGDSVTFGFRIEDDADTLPGQLERDLREVPGGELEVINGGCGGWSPWQELLFLQQEGSRYDPDLVILGFVLNDVTEKLDLERYQGSDVGFQIRHTRGPGIWDLLERTAIGHFLRQARSRRASLQERMSVYDLIGQPNRDDIQAAWKITQRSVDGILTWCREHDVPLLLVVFPYTVQLFPAERAEQNPPQWIMERFASRRELPMLDLRPVLVEVMSREGLTDVDLFMDALHPTVLGHRYISGAIRDTIVREDLLPR